MPPLGPLLVPPADRRRRLEPIHDPGPGGRSSGPAAGPVAADIDWLHDVLGFDLDAAPVTYLARVVDDELRLLVPVRPAAVAAAALRRPGGHRRPSERAQQRAGQLVGRLGLLAAVPGRRLTLPPFQLVDHLARVLGHPRLAAAVTLGPRRRNRKPVLQLIRPDGVVVGFAKIGWSPLTSSLVDNEATVLRLIEGRLPAEVVAPSVLLHEHWRNRSILVQSPLPLSTSTSTSASTWTSASTSTSASTVTPSLIQAIARCQPSPPVAVRHLPLIPRPIERLVERLVERHGEVVLPVGLWHGDLTPWNLAGRAGDTLVWDWELAAGDRPIGFDLLHHHFEGHRRQPGRSSATALARLVAGAGPLLAPLGLDLVGSRCDAIVDLYLCELIDREHRLSGQRWGSALADLGPAALELLDRRLG